MRNAGQSVGRNFVICSVKYYGARLAARIAHVAQEPALNVR
jgi:hypothetical protein